MRLCFWCRGTNGAGWAGCPGDCVCGGITGEAAGGTAGGAGEGRPVGWGGISFCGVLVGAAALAMGPGEASGICCLNSGAGGLLFQPSYFSLGQNLDTPILQPSSPTPQTPTTQCLVFLCLASQGHHACLSSKVVHSSLLEALSLPFQLPLVNGSLKILNGKLQE